MSTESVLPDEPQSLSGETISRWLTLLMASACGLVAANLYYNQPLVGPIAHSLGLSPSVAGFIVTMAQIGYGVGLLLIVPLADLVENRRLILSVLSIAILALAAASVTHDAFLFLVSTLFIGIGSVVVQILVPFASHLAPEEAQGRVVGNVMSGLMFGIMLARPVASFITDATDSWRMVFVFSTVVMVVLALVLARALPRRQPAAVLGYGALLASMGTLVRDHPMLRRRSLYHACLFAAFSLFWTVTPLLLAGPDYGFTQSGIALFALAGVAGVVAAPIAGRIADRGHIVPASVFAMCAVAAAFLITHLAVPGTTLGIALLVAAAVVLDFGVTMNLVVGQRTIYALSSEGRSRINGIYMATFFTGGAIGSALGAWAYAHGGWTLASAIGMGMPGLALVYLSTEIFLRRK